MKVGLLLWMKHPLVFTHYKSEMEMAGLRIYGCCRNILAKGSAKLCSSTPWNYPASADVTFGYDALNRVTEVTRPDGSLITPKYNEANLLDAMDVRIGGAAPPALRPRIQ